MLKYFLCFGGLCLSSYLSPMHAQEFAFSAKSERTEEIKKLIVFSERCSGSHFVESLLLSNLEIVPEYFGHKHFSPWYDHPQEFYLGTPAHYTFENTDDCLFVVIFRNPYEWAKSLHKNPWHADRSLRGISFSDFIHAKWVLDLSTVPRQAEINPLLDLNPTTGLAFQNIFELRTAKIKNLLLIKNRAKNVYYINYEKVCQYPQEVLVEIQSLYGLVMKGEYQPVIYYKGSKTNGFYKPKQYDPISYNDMVYINEHLDKAIEEEIGYQLEENYIGMYLRSLFNSLGF